MNRLLSIAVLLLLACDDHAAHTPSPAPPAPAPPPLPEELVPDEHGRVEVTVDAAGFHPSTVHVRRGAPLTLVVTRTEERGCGTEVVFPALDVRRPLPLGEPVVIEITPDRDELRFTCGMDMLSGRVVAH